MGSGPPTAPHLDDLTLSAVLDGEALHEEADHARACERCSARLDQMGAAASAVAVPPPPPDPERREAALAAALALGPGPVRRASGEGRRRPTDRRWRSLPSWAPLAVVAAAVALVVPVAGLLAGSGDDHEQETASMNEQERAGDDRAETGASEAAAAGPMDWGDLGEVDGGDLADLASATASAAAPEAGQDSSPVEAGGAGADADGEPGTASGSAPTCEAEARRREPGLGRLLAMGRASMGGQPVQVLAFEGGPGGGRGTRVVALVATTCAETASASG